MAKAKLQSNGFDLEITSPVALDASKMPLVLTLVQQLGSMHAVCPLAEFKVDQDNSNPAKFDYRAITVDGRTWHQELFIAAGLGTSMTFNAPQPWLLSEFVPNRAVRDTVDILLREAGVTKIRCTYT